MTQKQFIHETIVRQMWRMRWTFGVTASQAVTEMRKKYPQYSFWDLYKIWSQNKNS